MATLTIIKTAHGLTMSEDNARVSRHILNGKELKEVTNPIEADDLKATPRVIELSPRRWLVTNCDYYQGKELESMGGRYEPLNGYIFKASKQNRDRLTIWQNKQAQKERARILGSSWEWIDWQNSRRAMIGDRVCTIDGTTGTVTATSPAGVCIKFKSDRDGIEYSCGAYFIECAFNWDQYNKEKPARQQAAPLYTLNGEEYRQGDRVKIRTYYAELPEVVGILTRKEPQGSTIEVLADTGRTYYGWYGSTQRADAA